MKIILLQGVIASCLCLPVISKASEQEPSNSWERVSGFWVDGKKRLCWKTNDGCEVSTASWYIYKENTKLTYASGPNESTTIKGNWKALAELASSIDQKKNG